MNNSKKGLLLIILLVGVLIGIIGVGTIKEKYENKKNGEEYAASVEASTEAVVDSDAETEVENKEDSTIKGVPAKLRAKQDIKVLILGDAIAMSYGKTSENGIWSEGVKNVLHKNYGSNVSVEVIAQQDATTQTGIEQVKKAELSGYDIVILCYGYNDYKSSLKVEDVKSNYKAIVEKITKENSNAMIISVLESALEVNDKYRSAINEISTSKSLIVADMKNAFISSGIKESTLAANGYPNDHGYQIYTQTIENKIKQAIG